MGVIVCSLVACGNLGFVVAFDLVVVWCFLMFGYVLLCCFCCFVRDCFVCLICSVLLGVWRWVAVDWFGFVVFIASLFDVYCLLLWLFNSSCLVKVIVVCVYY